MALNICSHILKASNSINHLHPDQTIAAASPVSSVASLREMDESIHHHHYHHHQLPPHIPPSSTATQERRRTSSVIYREAITTSQQRFDAAGIRPTAAIEYRRGTTTPREAVYNVQRPSPAIEHERRAAAPREAVYSVQRPSTAIEHGRRVQCPSPAIEHERRAAAPREAVYNVQRPSPAFEYHTGTAIGRRGYLTPSGRQQSFPFSSSNFRPVIATPVALFPSSANFTQYTRRSRDTEVMQSICSFNLFILHFYLGLHDCKRGCLRSIRECTSRYHIRDGGIKENSRGQQLERHLFGQARVGIGGVRFRFHLVFYDRRLNYS